MPVSGDAGKLRQTQVSGHPATAESQLCTAVAPPADHHAERRVLKVDAAASRQATTGMTSPLTGSKRDRSNDHAAASDTAASDSDANPPRRRCRGDVAAMKLSSRCDTGNPRLDIPTADTSLFSPVCTLTGNRAAAELPDRLRTTSRRLGADKPASTEPSIEGSPQLDISVIPAIEAAAPHTPTRNCSAVLHGTNTPPSSRLPVCSPAKAAARKMLTYGVRSTASEGPSAEPDNAASSDSGESHWGDENEMENAHSAHDIQIRLSPGSEALQDAVASRSDASSSHQMPSDCRRLMCLDSNASIGGDSSDEELGGDDNAAMNELIQQASLQGESGGNPNEEEEEDMCDFDPYLFIRRLPPLTSVVSDFRDLLLPCKTRASKKKTLVLDLDETLVHSSLDTCEARPDFTFPVAFGGRVHKVGVQRRPYLGAFLDRVAEIFEVVVFTASQKIYAEQLLNVLDPQRRLIRHRIFRDSCIMVDGNYLKDLSVLGRDLSQTIIIDNSPQAFGYQLANGIPIESWYDDLGDCELSNLLPFLESLVHVADVRPSISAAFNLHNRVARALTPQPQY